MNKYRAIKVQDDGYTFDSKIEHSRYCELRLLQKAGEIEELQVHPAFEVRWPPSNKRICLVELDFTYRDAKGDWHYEDVKGFDTALSKLKRKLVEAHYGITVEVLK